MSIDTRPIALIGLPGSGKSTVGRLVASRLECGWVDLDERIESEAGASIPELFDRHGEPEFRRREAEALDAVLASRPGVISCGGGIATTPSARRRLADECRAVWLEVTPDQATRRLGSGATRRPLLRDDPAGRLATLLDERAPHYAAIACARVSTDGLNPADVAHAVLVALGCVPGSARLGGAAR